MRPIPKERLAQLADIQARAKYAMLRFDKLPKACRQAIANSETPCRQELRCLNRDCNHEGGP